jgi:hypothetical protein
MVMSLAGDQLFFEAVSADGRMLDCGLLFRTTEAEAKGASPEATSWVEACQAAMRVAVTTNEQ